MKDWRDKIRKNLGPNAEKYIFNEGKFEDYPEQSIVFFDREKYDAAYKMLPSMENFLPGVKIKLREYP